MKICLLNDSFPPLIDGVSNAVYNYASLLSSGGDAVQVATPWYPGVKDDYPFEVVRYNSANTIKFVGYRAGLPLGRNTLRTLTESSPDILHSHCPVASTILARALRETADAPVVMTYHTKFDIDIEKAIRGKRLQHRAIKALCDNITACDEIWVVSRGAGENLKSLGYSGDYIVMENGVDLPRGRVPDDEITSLRTELDLPENVPTFLFVGRMMWYKGIGIILDSLAALKEKGEDFRMIFVGEGTDKKEIEEKAASLGLSGNVIFTGAIRDREKLRAYFCVSDLFLFPSTFDTNGLVVREAAACALPSMLIRGSCAAEGIDDGFTGFLAEENAENFTSELLKTMHNTALLKTVGENAQNNIYISWADSVKNARARYDTVIENYKTNGKTRKKIRSDDFFELIGSVAEQLERAHARRMEIGARRRKMEESFWNFIDRYM